MTSIERAAAAGMIPEDEFREVWGAHQHLDGGFFSFADVVDKPLVLVWTIVESGCDEDGSWYAAPGIHVVNRIGFVMTRKSWEDPQRDAVYFLDDIPLLDDLQQTEDGARGQR